MCHGGRAGFGLGSLSCLGLENYWADVEAKLSTGSSRIKRRSKTLDQSESKSHSVKVPGYWITETQYQTDTGKDPVKDDGLELHDVEDPRTGNTVKAVFVPKHREGVFEGEFVAKKKVRLASRLDDDSNALRDGQVQQSFSASSANFQKALPALGANVPTIDAYNKRIADADAAGDTANAEQDFCVLSHFVSFHKQSDKSHVKLPNHFLFLSSNLCKVNDGQGPWFMVSFLLTSIIL